MASSFERVVIVLWSHLVSTCFCAWSSEYLGCFLNEDLNISNGIIVAPATLTHETCSDECLSKNYTYAALNNSLCRCTNNYMSKLTQLMDDDCNTSCSDNVTNKCRLRFKMFKTRNTSEESYPQAIYLGCYGERQGDDNNRLLKFPHERYHDNTPQKCSEECFKIGFLYSGTTNGVNLGTACWCGNQYPSKKFKLNDSKCDVLCSGDKTKNCGGFWRLSIYSTGIVDYPIGSSVGCFNINGFNSADKKRNKLKDNNNSNRCIYICHERGFKYAAVSEDICECSEEKPSIGTEAKKRDKCKKCEGDESEYCGGPEFLSIYEDYRFVTGNLSEKHFGCFESFWMYPVMEGWNVSFPRGLTSQNCVPNCYSRGFPYAALVSSKECLCSFVSPSLDSKVDRHHCNTTCDPEESENMCDDHTHYNVFTTGLHTPRVPGDYYMGCYKENKRADNKNERNEIAVNFPSANTPSVCSKHCEKEGFRYFGLTNRESCWCTNAPPDDGSNVADNKCSGQCPGDANKYCGGSLGTAAVFRIGTVADMIDDCPEECNCYFLPKYNVSTVNCSAKNLTESPDVFHTFKNTYSPIRLILKDNFLTFLPNISSLNITLLDISNNNVTTLDANLLPKSLKVLYIDNNKLTFLNDNALKLIQNLDTIKLKQNPWPCACDLRSSLIKYKTKIEDLNEIICSSSTQPFIHINEYDLCKKLKINYFYLGLVLGFILFICFLSVYFKLHKKCWLCLSNSQCKSCGIVSFQYNNNKNSSETFLQRIQYEELILATDNWNSNRILGRGGFGVVYKGNWRHTDVAIKRLKTEGVAEKVINMHTVGDELLNTTKEIMYLNAVKHDNILSMYGFCFHPTRSCLIYQYMANGSLEDRLQRKNGTTPLSWSTRGNISLGSARGLQFLHNMETPLIHGDIKSANILLDANFEPRIGDFGLARTGPLEENNKNVGFDVSHICGTRPYLPDDFCSSKKLSTKVDTYSFGIVMFEIATGLRAFNRYKNCTYLKDYVSKHDKSSSYDIADKNAGRDLFHVFELLISLGKSCVAKMAENRPEMVVVYTTLHNVMSSNVCTQQITEINEKCSSYAQSQETWTNFPQNQNKDLRKLDGIKAALLAPLHEIPSISDLYSNTECEILDPRKIITTELKSDNNEMSVCYNGSKYHKLK